MAADNYDECFRHVLGSEGGYGADPRDRGNWTTGRIGEGELKGTKYGISAMAYPHLDIQNLTLEDAKAIYKTDYWDKIEGDHLPYGVDLCTFDPAVNSGVSRGAKWLQRAVGVEADGDVGQATIEAVELADDDVTIDRMCDDRLNFLKGLPSWRIYGKGWGTRVAKVRKDSHQMVREAEPGPVVPFPKPEPLPPQPKPPIDLAALAKALHEAAVALERAALEIEKGI
jgi:lysozyme family protein